MKNLTFMKKVNFYTLFIIHCSLLIVHSSLLIGQCNVKALAHKGSSFVYPDNTLISIEQAFVEGAEIAEVDVRSTVDGVLILMHEGSVERITNGWGNVWELDYSYMKTLDCGSWKDKRFTGTKVPTLYDALKLADKYHKKLYLNMKDWVPELLAQTIAVANVPPDVCMPDPTTFDEIREYRKFLPNTPLVYYTEMPDTIDDEKFYKFLNDNNVVAVEIYAKRLVNLDEREKTLAFLDQIHKHNLKLWMFTVNSNENIQLAYENGIDGLESDRHFAVTDIYCNNGGGGYFPDKKVTGQWDFMNQDLSATIGSKMVEKNTNDIKGKIIQYGKNTDFGIAGIDGKNLDVAYLPGYDNVNGLQFFPNIVPEEDMGDFSCDNDYTIIMDILIPSTTKKKYIALFQTDETNSNDACLFVKPAEGTIGVLDNYFGHFNFDAWNRVVMVVNLPKSRIEITLNGQFAGIVPVLPRQFSKFCILNNWGGVQSLFFSDNDGEIDKLYVSSLQVRNYPMDSTEAVSLGVATYDKINQNVKFDASSCPELVKNPSDAEVNEGDQVVFSVGAGKNLNYSWQVFSGKSWNYVTGPEYSSAATANLKILNATLAMNNCQYRCLVSNDCVVTSSAATLKVNKTIGIQSSIDNSTFSINNSPNPFSNSTIIEYNLPDNCEVTLAVYNVTGQKIKDLLKGELQDKGRHAVSFDAKGLSNGVYSCKIEAKGDKSVYSTVKVMMLNR